MRIKMSADGLEELAQRLRSARDLYGEHRSAGVVAAGDPPTALRLIGIDGCELPIKWDGFHREYVVSFEAPEASTP